MTMIVMMMMVSAFHQRVNRCPVILFVCCSSSFWFLFPYARRRIRTPLHLVSCPVLTTFLIALITEADKKVWFGGKKEQGTTHGTANVKNQFNTFIRSSCRYFKIFIRITAWYVRVLQVCLHVCGGGVRFAAVPCKNTHFHFESVYFFGECILELPISHVQRKSTWDALYDVGGVRVVLVG